MAFGALHAPEHAGQAIGHPGLEVVGGPPLLVRALHQRGESLGVFAQRHQRLVTQLGVVTVAQVGGAGALLALRRHGAVRLPRVVPVRRQILFRHGLLYKCHIMSFSEW